MARSTKQSDLGTLSPEPVEVTIGDRTFVQRPLTLRRTAMLVAVVAEVFDEIANAPAMAQFLNIDLEEAPAQELVGPVVKLLAVVPDALTKIVTIILTGDQKEEDIEHIDEHTTLPQTMRILVTFVTQNEPDELIENFTVLRSTISASISRAQAKAKETAQAG